MRARGHNKLDDPFKDDFDDISSHNSTYRGGANQTHNYKPDAQKKKKLNLLDDPFEDSFIFVGDHIPSAAADNSNSKNNKHSPDDRSPKTPLKHNDTSILASYNNNHIIKPTSNYASSSKKTGNFELKSSELSDHSVSTRRHPVKAIAFDQSSTKNRKNSLLSSPDHQQQHPIPVSLPDIDIHKDHHHTSSKHVAAADNNNNKKSNGNMSDEYDFDFEEFSEPVNDNNQRIDNKTAVFAPSQNKQKQDDTHISNVSQNLSKRHSNHDAMKSPSSNDHTISKSNSVPKKNLEQSKSESQHKQRLSFRSSNSIQAGGPRNHSQSNHNNSSFLPPFSPSPSQARSMQHSISKSPSSIVSRSVDNTSKQTTHRSANRSASKGSSQFHPIGYVDKFAALLKNHNSYDKITEQQIQEENRGLQEKIYVLQTQLCKYADSSVSTTNTVATNKNHETSVMSTDSKFSSRPKRAMSSKSFHLDNEIAQGNRLIVALQGEYKKHLQRESVIREPSYLSKIRDEIASAEKVYQAFKAKASTEQSRKKDFEKKLYKISQNKGVSAEARAAQELRIEINTIDRKIAELKQQQAKHEEAAAKHKSSMEAKQKMQDDLTEKAKQQNIDTTVVYGKKYDKSTKKEIQKQLKDKIQNKDQVILQMEKQLRAKDDELRKELIQMRAQAKEEDDDLWLQQKELESQNRRMAAILNKAGIEIIEKPDVTDDFDDQRDSEVLFHERYEIRYLDNHTNNHHHNHKQTLRNSFLTEIETKVKSFSEHQKQQQQQSSQHEPEQQNHNNNKKNESHHHHNNDNRIHEEITEQKQSSQQPSFNFKKKENNNAQSLSNKEQTPVNSQLTNHQPSSPKQNHPPANQPSQSYQPSVAHSASQQQKDHNAALPQTNQQSPQKQQPQQQPQQQLQQPQQQPLQQQPQQQQQLVAPSNQQQNQSQNSTSAQQQQQQNNAENKQNNGEIDLSVPFRGVRRNRGGASVDNQPIGYVASYQPSMMNGNANNKQPDNNTVLSSQKPADNQSQQLSFQPQTQLINNHTTDNKKINTPQAQSNEININTNSTNNHSTNNQESATTPAKTFNFGARRTIGLQQQQQQSTTPTIPETTQKPPEKQDTTKTSPPVVPPVESNSTDKKATPITTTAQQNNSNGSGYTFLGPQDRRKPISRTSGKPHKASGFSLNDSNDYQPSFAVKDVSEIGTKDITISSTTNKTTTQTQQQQPHQASKVKEESESNDEFDFLKPGAAAKPNYDDDDDLFIFSSNKPKKQTTLAQNSNSNNPTKPPQQDKTQALAQKANKTDLLSEFDF